MRVLCLFVPRFSIHLAVRSCQDLGDRPLAMLQGAGDTALVAAASAPAAAAGVLPGMPAADARRRCPATVFLPDNAGDCFDHLDRLAAIIRIRATPLVAIGGRDHLFVDLAGTQHLYASEETAATRLAELASAWLKLPARAGVASSRLEALEVARAARFRPLVAESSSRPSPEPSFAGYQQESLAVEAVLDARRDRQPQLTRLLARLNALLAARAEGYREAWFTLESGMTVSCGRLDGLSYDASALLPWLDTHLAVAQSAGRPLLRLELRRLCPDARVASASMAGTRHTAASTRSHQSPLRATG
jgi:nucleotidyltransferase/DNA polymerase involved in DNA repair